LEEEKSMDFSAFWKSFEESLEKRSDSEGILASFFCDDVVFVTADGTVCTGILHVGPLLPPSGEWETSKFTHTEVDPGVVAFQSPPQAPRRVHGVLVIPRDSTRPQILSIAESVES